MLKKLLIQAHAFRRAASSSNEFDDADFALLGICGDFATAGERFVAAEKVWNEREKEHRQAAAAAVAQMRDGDEGGSEVGKRKRGGKGKGKEERVWTDREYIKACEELAHGAVEIDGTKQCVLLSPVPCNSVGQVGSRFGWLIHILQPLLARHHAECLVEASARVVRPPREGIGRPVDFVAAWDLGPPRRRARRRHQVSLLLPSEESLMFILPSVRCLIAGPEHSPYAGGLFEFDIFLPLRECGRFWTPLAG